MRLRVHAEIPRSRANGPGVRYAVWVQGCDLGCPGCFNPETHAGGGDEVAVDDLVARIVAIRGIEGVTISGGEPLQQPDGLESLVRALRETAPALSILVFSGYAIDEIRAMPRGPAIVDAIDVLIDGRYVAGERMARGLRGSANQRIRLLSDRYRMDEITGTPEAEVSIATDGSVTVSGVAPLRLK